MMRSLACSKADMPTALALSMEALSAATFTRLAKSAPLNPGVPRAITDRSTSWPRGIFLKCASRICRRPSTSGLGTTTCRSNRPGRVSALSRLSGKLVAPTTMIPSFCLKPSISTRSWFSVILRYCWSLGLRLPPTASISSMKTMEGAISSATRKSSRTSLGPSPRYFWISSEPTTRRKEAEVALATAFASSVLPVPGSPYRMTPFGGLIPMSSYSSGWERGSSTASLISWIWVSSPPTSAYDSSGAFSTFITETMGSVSSPRMPTTLSTLLCIRMLHPGSSWPLSTNDMMLT
mmetsp:Transcript_7249/g.20544  ORF Transcript_7249/g.20544 Transcript_7249/m.20544 type:complete len:293 (-) Transcript_7249:389-1267(-)